MLHVKTASLKHNSSTVQSDPYPRRALSMCNCVVCTVHMQAPILQYNTGETR